VNKRFQGILFDTTIFVTRYLYGVEFHLLNIIIREKPQNHKYNFDTLMRVKLPPLQRILLHKKSTTIQNTYVVHIDINVEFLNLNKYFPLKHITVQKQILFFI